MSGALRRATAAAAIGLTLSCDTVEPPTAPAAAAARVPGDIVGVVRQLAVERGIGRMPEAPAVRPSLVRLGRALAFDRILSGNRDISCMTCHLPAAGTGDGRSLAIGQGATGLGTSRVHPDGVFIPRNAPPLFNLTALESLFWDGRIGVDDEGHVRTPAGAAITQAMTRVFEFGAVSALGLFPVLSREEMRAASGNELAAIPDTEPRAVWRALMQRLGAIPEYRQLFERAYPGTAFENMTFAHASNAIAGFMISDFRFTDTPWDRFLAGHDDALSAEQLAGAQTFLSIRCSLCHNGPAFTDNRFHNVAVAQFGPGQGHGPSGRDDFGRFAVTGAARDRYAFRTTPLRNVTVTAPYGHDGAFFEVRDFIAHYSESDVKLRDFVVPRSEPLLHETLLRNFEDILLTRDSIIHGVVLPEQVIDQLTTFMTALTDPAVRTLYLRVPNRVPSGLPVDRL
jgi:cytochrome c peroxidase